MAATVAPDHILKELAELWVSLGKQENGEAGAGVLRACSMTLVVLTEEGDDLAALGETIAALMPEHPARAIVVRLHGGTEPALSERVYSQCWMPFGQRRQICCEQIELTASDASIDDLPSVVLPLAVPDLPLILWCRSARLLSMPEFRRIVAMARKVVVDSAKASVPAAALTQMQELNSGGVLLGDLSWTRLTRWREMLSQVFENQVNLTKLVKVAKVEVQFGEDLEPAARLMGVWIKEALAKIGVDAKLDVTPGSGLRVKMTGEGLDVELYREEERLVVKVNGQAQCTNLPQASDYLLMREELAIVRPDIVFNEALSAAANL